MKKNLLALLATLILTFAFSVSCFAAVSPSANVIPTDDEVTTGGGGGGSTTEGGGGNTSQTSPKTGANVALGFVAVVSAAGVALVSKKKFSEAE